MPITQIYGPECLSIVYDYIAHETDAPGNEVPIIMEDSGGNENIIPENAVFGGGAIECLPGDIVCCMEPDVFLFVNEAVTEIVYGAVLQAAHGENPSVFVYYFHEEDDSFSILGDYTRIAFDAYPINKITVSHGGLQTGKIKIV
jgi:hypothetical protein